MADLCERLQCPGDYIGVSVIAGAGSVIGRKVLVRPHLEDDWAVVANQWAMGIGRPGVMKSPAMDEALRPLKQLACLAEQQFKADQARYAVDAAAAKLRRDENLRAAAKIIRNDHEADISYLLEETAESEPTLRRYIANDTTVEFIGRSSAAEPEWSTGIPRRIGVPARQPRSGGSCFAAWLLFDQLGRQ